LRTTLRIAQIAKINEALKMASTLSVRKGRGMNV